MPESNFPPPGDADGPEYDDREHEGREHDERDDLDGQEEHDGLEPEGEPGEGDEPDRSGEGGPRAVFVSTAIPVQVSVAPMDDERAPEGSALGSYIGERLVARCAMPREAVERLIELDLFSEPVPLALLAVEEEPGLQCRLFALVPAERLMDSADEDEPWRASVPSFEDSLHDDDDDEGELVGGGEDGEDGEDGELEDEDTAVASILLGHIVRFQKDRKFAGDLTAEAVDVLQKIVLGGGPLLDANARAVDDFLDSL